MFKFFSDAAAFAAAIVKAIVAFVQGLMVNTVKTTTRTLFPFQSSWNAGYRPAFLVGNRGIDRNHLDGLRALLKESGKTKFTVCGAVTPLLPILELMAGLPEADRLHFYDIQGNEITLDTPGVREGLYYLVLDGQHRVGACYVYGLDMDLQLVEIEGDPIEFISDYNTGGKSWQTRDWVKAHRATGIYTSDLYVKMDEVGEILPAASERFKIYILTGNRDGIKKSDAIHGKEAIDYDEKLALRGIEFARAIAVRLPRTGKDLTDEQKLVAKYFTSLMGIDLVYHVKTKITGELLASFETDMKNFLANLSDKQVKEIATKIEAKNLGDLQKFFLAEYKKYAEAHAADREALSSAIDAKYTKLAEKRGKKAEEDRKKALTTSSDPKERPSKLKEGTLDEMKKNAEAIQRYLEKKETLDKAKGIKH